LPRPPHISAFTLWRIVASQQRNICQAHHQTRLRCLLPLWFFAASGTCGAFRSFKATTVQSLKGSELLASSTPSERRVRLYQQWSEIVATLEREIAGVAAALPRLELNASGMDLKAFEDMLDAIVCAWVAICTLARRAMPFGDDNSAIWIPSGAAAVSLKK
jgi:hypothetical protein